MKYAILFALLLSSTAFGYDVDNNDDLVCATIRDSGYNTRAVGVSCVSKASIELDKINLKIAKLQLRKLEVEIKMMEEMGQLPPAKKGK